SGHENLAKEMA
ncbi:hypothetical protein Tco_0240329, partial [Tanacetum coccineum]